MRSEAQPTPHSELGDYEVVLIVAGSRGYDDYEFFSEIMFEHEATFGGKKIIYVSGAASTGADAMIIRWCKEHGRPWSEFPADWDDISSPGAQVRINKAGKPFNVVAGYIRNREMALVGTDLITFYDGFSNGTRDMTQLMSKKVGREHVVVNLVTMSKDKWG